MSTVNTTTDGAGAGGAAGGGATNNGGGILFEGNTTGGGGSSGGNGGSGGASSNGGSGAGGNNTQAGQTGGTKNSIPDNWKDYLPDDLKSHASLEVVKDVPTLVKNYINAQKMIGADKIAIPGQHSSKEDWKNVFSKLGLPEKIEDYKVEVPKDSKVDKEFVDGLIKAAHENNILPAQAKGLLDWFMKADEAAYAKEVEANKTKIKEGIINLQNEWGDAYNVNISRAKAALREFADKEVSESIQKTNLGSNPAIIKLLAKVGETLSEDKIKGEGGGGFGALSPAQAQAELDSITKNLKHAYYDAAHSEHSAAKKRVRELYGMIATQQKIG